MPVEFPVKVRYQIFIRVGLQKVESYLTSEAITFSSEIGPNILGSRRDSFTQNELLSCICRLISSK